MRSHRHVRGVVLAMLGAAVFAADATPPAAIPAAAIPAATDPDRLAVAIDPTWRPDGHRDDQGRFDGVISFLEHGTGKIREIRAFSHGIAEGLYTAYDGNGQLRVQGQTQAGKAVGVWTLFTAQGAVMSGIDCDDPRHPAMSATAVAAATRAAPASGDRE